MLGELLRKFPKVRQRAESRLLSFLPPFSDIVMMAILECKDVFQSPEDGSHMLRRIKQKELKLGFFGITKPPLQSKLLQL